MFRLLLLVAVAAAAAGLVAYFVATAPPPQPTVYYNDSGLWILSPVRINGTQYRSARIPAGNMSVVRGIEYAGRKYAYAVGYSLRWLHYDGVDKYAVVEVQNLGNATLYFGGRAIQASATVRLRDPPLPPPPPSNVTLTVLQCTPSGCQLNLLARLDAPYGGRVPARIVTASGARDVSVQFGKVFVTQLAAPYGSQIEFSTPWGAVRLEVRPNITAWIGGYNLTCRTTSCYYTVRVYVSSEVPAQVRIQGPNRVYDLSLFRVVAGTAPETVATAKTYVDVELPPGDACLGVLPTGQSLCLSLPYEPPRLVVEEVRWIYYSPTEVLAVLRVGNPGHAPFSSDVYCANCGPPRDDQMAVLRSLAYGAVPLAQRVELRPLSYAVFALRVAASGGALSLLANNSEYRLAPPPLPPVNFAYNVSLMLGSPPDFAVYDWVVTRYAEVRIWFDRPDVVYTNFVRAYAGNATAPVSCSGQVCAAYIPLEMAPRGPYARPPGGWLLVNGTARPASAYVATPWGVIRVA